MLNELAWMGSFDRFANQPDAAAAVDRNRAFRAFLLFEQANRIGLALNRIVSAPGAAAAAKSLKDRLNRLVTQNERSQDALFELEMAGRLARSGVPVEFAEPDIVVRIAPDLAFAFACKRPRSQKRLNDRLFEAAKQIKEQCMAGIILIGMEAILHTEERGQVVVYQSNSAEELQTYANARLNEHLQPVQSTLRRVFESPLVEGVIFCGLVTAMVPNAYRWAWVHRGFVNPSDVSSTPTVTIVGDLLFGEGQRVS